VLARNDGSVAMVFTDVNLAGKIDGVELAHFVSQLSVIKCFETDGGVNYRSDRLI
jgi:hypothetical protein